MIGIDIEMPNCCAECEMCKEEKVLDSVSNYCSILNQDITLNGKRLDDCPLVEIEEHKVGKWKAIDDTHSQCMECGAIFCITSSNEWELNYCPNCGAEMRGNEK